MVAVKPKLPLNAKTKKSTRVEKVNKKTKPQKPQVNPQTAQNTKIIKQVSEEIKKEAAPKKKVKYIMPSQSVTEDLVSSCLNALLDVVVAHDKQKNAIFDDEKPIFAEIHCIKIQNTRGNIKLLLPHSTVASTGEVCLVTPDIKKGRKHDHEPTIDRWEEILRKEGVTGVKTVLPVRQLRVEYDQFELKRRLLTQHDFIMVDTRVLNHVSHLLGKMFFKKHNMLIPVRINEDKNLKKSIKKGLRTAILRLSEGETSTITIGHTAMPQEKLKENIMALVEQLKTKFPGGEANIRSISLKLPLSMSLPLYLTLRKMFFKKHNMLIPVRINEDKNLKKSIKKGLRTAILRLSEGETSTITIGHTAMPQEKLKENIMALVEQLKTKFPGGEANIRSISLKLPLSMSLPLYLTLRPSSTIKPPKLTQKRPKHYTVLEDELSTIPGKTVRVAPDGTVKLKRMKSTPKASAKEKVVLEDIDEDQDQESDESEANDD